MTARIRRSFRQPDRYMLNKMQTDRALRGPGSQRTWLAKTTIGREIHDVWRQMGEIRRFLAGAAFWLGRVKMTGEPTITRDVHIDRCRLHREEGDPGSRCRSAPEANIILVKVHTHCGSSCMMLTTEETQHVARMATFHPAMPCACRPRRHLLRAGSRGLAHDALRHQSRHPLHRRGVAGRNTPDAIDAPKYY